MRCWPTCRSSPASCSPATASWTSHAMAVTRYGREELERSGSMQATSWSRLVITAPAVSVAVRFVVGLKLVGALPTQLTWVFVAIALGSGVSLIAAEHMLNLLEAAGRMKRTAVGVVAQRAVSIVAIVFVAALGAAHSAAAIALVWLATGLLFAAWLGASVWRVGLWPVRFDRALLRRMVRFSRSDDRLRGQPVRDPGGRRGDPRRLSLDPRRRPVRDRLQRVRRTPAGRDDSDDRPLAAVRVSPRRVPRERDRWFLQAHRAPGDLPLRDPRWAPAPFVQIVVPIVLLSGSRRRRHRSHCCCWRG